jgi:hypothetical protein
MNALNKVHVSRLLDDARLASYRIEECFNDRTLDPKTDFEWLRGCLAEIRKTVCGDQTTADLDRASRQEAGML